MPIDYRIGAVAAPNPDDNFLSGISRGIEMRGDIARARLADLTAGKLQDDINRTKELRSLITNSYRENPDITKGQLGRVIAPYDYQEGFRLQDAQKADEAALRAAEEAKAKAEREHFDDTAMFAANYLNNAKSPADIQTFFKNTEPLVQTGYLSPKSIQLLRSQIMESPDPVKSARMFSQSLIPITKQQELAIDRARESGLMSRSAADRAAQMERLKFEESQKNYRENLKTQNDLKAEQQKKEVFLKQLPPNLVKYYRGDQELTKDDVLAIKKKAPATASFLKSIDDIIDVIDKGGINVANPTSKEYAKIETLITDLGAQYRKIGDLGVPNAGDQALTTSFIGDPARLRSQFKEIKTTLNTAKSLIHRGFNDEMQVRGFEAIPENDLTGKSSSPGNYVEFRNYQGKRYGLKPGADRNQKSSWEEVK